MKTDCENYSPLKKPAFPCGHCPKMVPGCNDTCKAFQAARDRLVQTKGSCDTCEFWRDDHACGWQGLNEEVDALASRLSRFRAVKE